MLTQSTDDAMSSKNKKVKAINDAYVQTKNQTTIQISNAKNARRTLDQRLVKQSKDLYGTEYYTVKKSNAKTIFWILALIFAAAFEIPWNIAAFELIDVGRTATLVLAISFGLIIATIAHFAGRNIKRGYVEDKAVYIFISLILMALASACLWTSAGYRIEYGRVMNPDNVDNITQLMSFTIAMAPFIMAVVGSATHTSKIKNLEAEKAFNNDLDELVKTDAILSTLEANLISLEAKRNADLDLVEQEYTNSVLQAKLDKQAKDDQDLLAFESEESLFEELFLEAEKAFNDNKESKEELINSKAVFDNFFQNLEDRLDEMSKCASEEAGTKARLLNAKNKFNNLKSNYEDEIK